MTFRQDLVFGARMLLARPGFTVAAVLSLALGIGANTTIFSLINSSLLADLPYRESERLVALWTSFVDRPAVRGGVTGANYLTWKEQSRSFEAVGGNFGFTMNLGSSEDGAPAERIEVCDSPPRCGTCSAFGRFEAACSRPMKIATAARRRSLS